MIFVCVLRMTCMCHLVIFFAFPVNDLYFILILLILLIHVKNNFSFAIIIYIIIIIITIILFFQQHQSLDENLANAFERHRLPQLTDYFG